MLQTKSINPIPMVPKTECCKSCKNNFTGGWDIYCISRIGICVDCKKKEDDKPENDPENKKFEIQWEDMEQGVEIIYAKDEKQAREHFAQNFEGDIIDIIEVKR